MTADIETFKQLYQAEFNIELSDDEAEQMANILKRVYVAVYGSPKITTK